MKKIISSIAFLLVSVVSFAQGTVQLTVRWSVGNSRYEVYARPNFTLNNFNWGPSQISVVLPASAPDQSLVITSHAAGSWADNSKRYAPSAQPANDFHGVESSGSPVNLVSGQETLIFSFVFPDGVCRDGIRLFINNTDPSSSAAGMSGGDFKNAIANALLADVYISNYGNTGTSCSACSITAPTLSKQ